MRRRAVLLLLAGAAAVAAPARASELPYGPTLTFAAFRNGERIGTHALRFERDAGGRLTVSTTIELAVKFMGFTAYRYHHRAREIWNGDSLQALASETNDNGRTHAVRAEREADTLVVSGDGGARRLAGPLLPSSHWNVRQVGQARLLNTQTGAEARVQVTPLGRERVATASGSLDATRYRYTGDVAMEQWFDDRGRWVKTSFVASDGSTVEYVLQE